MRKILFILSIMFSAALGGTSGFATVNDDQVTSQKIKEADGTSAQNTNSGSGVKTNHIQNSAVTSTKIADGAVTTSKIPASAVTSTNIADGAVTDSKIAGPITGSKISSTGLNADTVDGQHATAFASTSHVHSMTSVSGLQASLADKSDVTHNHDTLYQQKYGKVAIVAKTGGDYTDPVTAMSDIAAWCGTASAANPCLLKIMPGVYDIGPTSLIMTDYVDIEGSGENSTKITGNISPIAVPQALVQMASNTEIRLITLENISSGANAIAISSWYNSAPKITHVTLSASAVHPYCVVYTAYFSGSNATMSNVTVQAICTGTSTVGIFNDASSSSQFTNTVVSSTGGSNAYGIFNLHASSVLLNNVSVTSSGIALFNTESWGPASVLQGMYKGNTIAVLNKGILNVAGSGIDGPIQNTNVLKLVNCFDGAFNPISNQ